MQLHRASVKPDWTTIKAGDYNLWQRVAVLTKGVVTPGNIVTLIGFVIVLAGLDQITRHHFWVGGIALAAGRTMDIVDGWLAQITGTKSPLGEMLDAGLDKVGTLLTLIVFFYAGVALWWALAALALPHLIISAIALRANSVGVRLHPSRIGKLSMVAAWVSLLGFVAVKATEGAPSSFLTTGVYALSALSVAMGLYAALGYALGRD